MRVLIVGAGPAGLSTALAILDKSDITVTVVDEKKRIGEPQRCAGGVSLWMLEKEKWVLPAHTVLADILKVRIYAPNNTYYEVKQTEKYGHVVDRVFLEQKMAENVESLKGTILLENQVTPSQLEVYRKGYNCIVGADGPCSVVRKWLCLPKLNDEDMHMGVQETLEMDSFPQDTIEIYFGEKVAPGGYAWIFPAGHNLVRIGLGVPSSRGWMAWGLLNSFIQRQVIGSEPISRIAKLIPTTKTPKTGFFPPDVFLVGDALPTTDPFTGGGIIQSMIAGKALGEAIVKGDPLYYDRKIAWLRKQNNTRYRLKRVICGFADEDFNDLIESLKPFNLKSFSLGKELRRATLHLMFKKPRLFRKVLRGYI